MPSARASSLASAPEIGADARTTRDAFFGGRVVLNQPAKHHGYRVNVDALLLATFALDARARRPGARTSVRHAVDLGAGVGAVGLSLLYLGGAERVTLVEVDPWLAELARANARDNGLEASVEVVCHDVSKRPLPPLGEAELVVCNPPYVPPGRGRVPAEPHAQSRMGRLDIFLDAARQTLGRRASVCFVYPAIEAVTLLYELRKRGLEPKRMRYVHAKAKDSARVVLVEARAAKPGGLTVETPLIELTEGGVPSEALAALFAR